MNYAKPSMQAFKPEVLNIPEALYINILENIIDEKYIKDEEFEEDIKNNYRDNATISACAYNIYVDIDTQFKA